MSLNVNFVQSIVQYPWKHQSKSKQMKRNEDEDEES